MSLHFGPIFQNAYIVQDFDKALEHWTKVIGVGPFYLFPMPIVFSSLEYRGRPATNRDLTSKVALAYSGDTQIEIIQPGTAPSPYHEFLDAGHRGLQHLGALAHDFDAQLEAARRAGVPVAMEGVLPGFRFAYLETDVGHPGAMIELIELAPEAKAMIDMIKAASVGWDGRDPVRNV